MHCSTRNIIESARRQGQQGKGDAPHLKVKVVRIHSMLRFTGEPGPNYLALVDLANDKLGTKVSTTTYGTRIWETAVRMKGSELYQIRNDIPLLLRLRSLVDKDKTRPSIANWDKVITMFQLPANLKLRTAKKGDKPQLDNVVVKNTDGQGTALDGSEAMSDS